MKAFIKAALSDHGEPSSTRLNVFLIAGTVLGVWCLFSAVYLAVWVKSSWTCPVPLNPPVFVVIPWVCFAILGTAMGIKEVGSIMNGTKDPETKPEATS